MNRSNPIVAALPALVAVLLVLGCSKQLRLGGLPNQLPEVLITQAPRDTNVVCDPLGVSSCYAVTIQWIGHDPDGAIDHYNYAVDPPSGPDADTTWQSTRSSSVRLTLSATREIPLPPSGLPMARDHHVFVVQAVDNRGARGPSVAKAFFAYTQAPDVYITNPLPSSVSIPILTPSVRISWQGQDEDGVVHTKPVKYKYTLLTPSTEYSVERALRSPDSLRMHFAPGFASWDSVGGDTTSVQIRNLSPDQEYLFVVVGFDEAGAYSPIFRLTTNMLRFRVGFAGQLGPRITAFSEFFTYEWRSSYCANCPSTELFLEIPAGKALPITWTGVPAAGGADMHSYRWAIDIDDVYDNAPRQGPDDLSHWSAPSLNGNSMTLGPYRGSEEHRLYIEAADNLGLKSLAVIRVVVVPANFRPGSVLIVKDTRFPVDNLDRATNCSARPRGAWPMQAELDTFLFARGGVPWRCYVPAAQSPPGVFQGWRFDTLGTRIRKSDLSVRLSTLARYEHVVWITDFKGATNSADGVDISNGQTALRYMSAPGRFNSLAAYGRLGGRIWMVGAGTGYANMIPWDRTANNQPQISFSSSLAELVPGRLMYDLVRWRSAFRSTSEAGVVRRYFGRHEGRPSDEAPWTRYASELPVRLEFKTSATDPLPPYRSAGDLYYVSTAQLEYLYEPNVVLEDIDPDPDHVTMGSTLDTLYHATGIPSAGSNPHNVVMTHARAPSYPHGIVFSGFDLWVYRKAHVEAIIDFVFRRIWNLTPLGPQAGADARAASTAPGAGVTRAPRMATGAGRRDVPARRGADSPRPR